MTWDNSKYVKLSLGRAKNGKSKYLIALRTTADYYGWTEEFEVWRPKVIRTIGAYSFGQDPGRRGEMFCEPGRRHRICRSASKDGHPAGFTNQFKVSTVTGIADLAELAHFTKGDWHWMSGPTGNRLDRAEWERLYQSE